MFATFIIFSVSEISDARLRAYSSDLLATTSAGPAGEGLAPLPFAEARFAREIGALTRKDHALSPLAKRFLEILRESASPRA